MGHLDKRMDAEKDAPTEKEAPVKDGISGNVQESRAYQDNKGKDLAGGSAPDLVQKGGATKTR